MELGFYDHNYGHYFGKRIPSAFPWQGATSGMNSVGSLVRCTESSAEDGPIAV